MAAHLADEDEGSNRLTSTRQTFGTADYMAPEQWDDARAADARTDLYALGCTLFYLLVGRPPYGTAEYRSTTSKMKGHILDPIPDLQKARADVPDAICEIYRTLLAKLPEERYQSAQQLAADLTPFSSLADARDPDPYNGRAGRFSGHFKHSLRRACRISKV